MGTVGAPSAFDLWFQSFVAYAGPILNLLFWVVMMVAVIWAVMLFKRLVDFQTGAAKPSEGATEIASTTKEGGAAIDIEEFVE